MSNFRSPMKIGTDGVLLGALAGRNLTKEPSNILDVGTGSGVIALMLAQRFTNADVIGLDIDSEAFFEASDNAMKSPFSNRVEIILADFSSYNTNKQFDLIVSNPPFFSEAIHSPNQRRDNARHGSKLPLSVFLSCARKLISSDGHIVFIYPYNRLEEVKTEVAICGLEISELISISSSEGAVPIRIIVDLTLSNNSCNDYYFNLAIRNKDGEFTPDYKYLLKDFYLAF